MFRDRPVGLYSGRLGGCLHPHGTGLITISCSQPDGLQLIYVLLTSVSIAGKVHVVTDVDTVIQKRSATTTHNFQEQDWTLRHLAARRTGKVRTVQKTLLVVTDAGSLVTTRTFPSYTIG